MSVLKDATAVVSTIGVSLVAFAGPSPASVIDDAGSDEQATGTPTANGDGYLSDDELAGLTEIPTDEVTSADLADVTEVDLTRLPQALQDRIRAPVQLRYADVPSPDVGVAGRALSGNPTKQVSGQWWHENAYGWHLTDYYIAVSFSYNGTKVIEATDWSWGNGHWGYQFCNEDARGSRWVNSSHTHYQAFGRGLFGPPSCAVVTMSNGGTVNVNGRGDGWLS